MTSRPGSRSSASGESPAPRHARPRAGVRRLAAVERGRTDVPVLRLLPRARARRPCRRVETDERFTTFLRGARVDSVAPPSSPPWEAAPRPSGDTSSACGRRARREAGRGGRARGAPRTRRPRTGRRGGCTASRGGEPGAGRAREKQHREDRLRLEQRRLELAVRERERDIEDVVGSASWRLTSPLRRAKRGRTGRAVCNGGEDGRERRSAPALAPPREAPRSRRPISGCRPLVSVVTPVTNVGPGVARSRGRSVRAGRVLDWQLCLAERRIDGSERTLEYLRVLEAIPDQACPSAGTAASRRRRTVRSTRPRASSVAFLDQTTSSTGTPCSSASGLDERRTRHDVVTPTRTSSTGAERTSRTFPQAGLVAGALPRRHVRGPPSSWCAARARRERSAGSTHVRRRAGLRADASRVRATSRIEHVPRVLYHWRKLPGSVAQSVDAKDGISELQAEAVSRHLRRREIPSSPGRT